MSAASGLCGVCSQWREWGQGAEFEVVVPGQSPPATGLCRFGRQLHPPVLALGLQNGPERRACLGWNERKFLSLLSKLEIQNPDDPYILAVKAVGTGQQGSLEEAERLYQRPLKIDPNWVVAYDSLLLAETLLADGKDAEAHQLIARVRGINPAMVEEFEESGFRLLGLGRGESSIM